MSQPTQDQPQYQQAPQPQYQPAPQIIIQNHTSSSSSAAAAASASVGGLMPRKRHSVAVHVILFLFTAGLGNLVYWWWIASENKKRGY